jgi:predicted membrane-bound spermidine synthase
MSSRTAGVLAGLALVSGACALAYELLYVRILTTLMGDRYYVPAAILSAFMIGIGAGAALARRFRPWLFLFEILTGAYALAFPSVVGWLSGAKALAAVTGSPPLTILVTAALVAAPATLVGFSIPLFSGYVKAVRQERGAFGAVYTLYHLGTVLSVVAVEFLFIRALGFRSTLALVGAANIAGGILLWALLRREGAPKAEPGASPRRFPARGLWALGIASFASAAFQMFFFQLCFHAFQPHRENFAIGIVMSVLGIFVGTLAVTRFRIGFVPLMLAGAAWIGLTYGAHDLVLKAYQAWSPGPGTPGLVVVAHKFFFGALFGLGPMACFGATIPAMMLGEEEVAGESGRLLGISCAANAAGYVAYVVVLHEAFPLPVLLAGMAAAALLAGTMAAGFRLSPGGRNAALLAAGLALLVVLRWDDRYFYAAGRRNLGPDDTVKVSKSGPDDATIVRTPDSSSWIVYNGHAEIRIEEEGRIEASEMMSGVIPALAAPRLERALVLGHGAGITAGTTARIFERTDIVEINNAFLKLIPELRAANLDVDRNPGATIHLADGRSFLVGREGEYDAIVNSIPAPDYFSASKVYTVEFYERVARALKPDGIFCTWLAVPNMSMEGVKTILSALRRQFEHADLRLVSHNYYMATCSRQPIRVRRWSELPAKAPLPETLAASVAPFEPGALLEDLRVTADLFAAYFPEVERQNTDDLPVLEFMVARLSEVDNLRGDLFFDGRAGLGIDAVRARELADPRAFARRARAFERYGPDYFNGDFLPLLARDPARREAFERLPSGK